MMNGFCEVIYYIKSEYLKDLFSTVSSKIIFSYEKKLPGYPVSILIPSNSDLGSIKFISQKSSLSDYSS